MRNNMKIKDGYMTVEATIVFPILLFSFALFVYLIIYIYDKSLLEQDAYTMAVYGSEEYHNHSDVFLNNLDEKFIQIKNERPYLAYDDISVNVSKHGNFLSVKGYLLFHTPIGELVPMWFPQVYEAVSTEKKITVEDPVSIMMLTEDLSRIVMGEDE